MANGGVTTRVLEWLLGLDHIRLGRDAPLVLMWDRQVPAWMIFCFAVAVIGAAVVVYRREQASVACRFVSAVARCAAVGVVAAILCGPSLVLQRNRVEPSYIALALDTSQSMGTHDKYARLPRKVPGIGMETPSMVEAVARGAGIESAADVEKYSRIELLQAALTAHDASPLKALLARNEVRVYTFAGAVEPRGAVTREDSVDALADLVNGAVADGTRTDLAGAITRLLEDTQGRRLAAVVLATDGQATERTSIADAIDLARGRQIPVFAIRIGSARRIRDIVVGPVRAEASAFVNDLLAVEVQVSADGLIEPTQVTVRLIDEVAERAVASREVVLGNPETEATVELLTKPTRSGRVRYRVEVPPLPGERQTKNNVDHVEVAIVDDHLRVLYVDGYPRYEYRYLKNALLREDTMDLSVLLLEADKSFVQEGTVPIRRFPETPEELNRYDVVIFGDVDPRGGWLTGAQMNMLLDFVGHGGGGFGLIAGERAAPQRFLGTPLEKLIPVRIDPEFLGHYDESLKRGFRVRLTPEGLRSRLFRFSTSPDQSGSSDADVGHPLDSLPELYWIARTLGPKPGAGVLAEHDTLQLPGDSSGVARMMPVVVTGRYGAGRIFFQATDDTWRWRRHTGELLHDTYWVRVARELMRPDRVQQDRRFRVRTDRKAYAYGSPVHARVEVLDMQLLSGLGSEIELVMTGGSERRQTAADGAGKRPAGRGKSSPPGTAVSARFFAHRLGEGANTFEGTLIPPYPGSFSIEAEGLTEDAGRGNPAAAIRVERPDLEARRIEADHDMLGRIAAGTGGRLIEIDELEDSFSMIKDRSVRIPDDLREPLWDSKLILILFGLMISMEWVLRKVAGLI